MSLAQDIKFKLLELGFDLVGVTDASPIDTEQVNLFADWLNYGYAGQMGYLHKNLEKRINPAKLLKNAQSVICVGLNYKPPRQNSKPSVTAASMGKMAIYALYEDYHTFIKKKLRTLIDFVASTTMQNHKFKICVDSAPLTERALAARAGLGFIGKNHMLINPTLGPQIFLGEIVTTLKLNPDEPISDGCPSCNKCISACPTGALKPDGQFDANKCINYLTIEYKGQIPTDLAEKIGDRLFGCDECVLACPYQQNAPICKSKQFKFYPGRANLDLNEVLDMTEEEFENLFSNSVLLRPGLDLLKRNAKICLDNIISRNH